MKNYIIYDLKNDRIHRFIYNTKYINQDINYKYIEFNNKMKIKSNMKLKDIEYLINNYSYINNEIETNYNWETL